MDFITYARDQLHHPQTGAPARAYLFSECLRGEIGLFMAAKRVSGERVTGGASDQTMYTGPGRLLGILVSHSQSSAQSITLKDDTSILLQLWVHLDRSPVFINLGMGERDKLDGIEFTKSLIANAGLNSQLNLWYIGY